MYEESQQVRTILDLLRNEVSGDVSAALKKMAEDYTMTWMYQGKSELFPSSKPDFTQEMKEVYAIPNRKYEIKNIAEGKDVVMIELIETYTDEATGQPCRTPLVIVIELKEGRARTGRHYCDPAISRMHLSAEQVETAYSKSPTKFSISKEN